MTAKLRCVLLDDFQGAALRSADWSAVADEVDLVTVREHPADQAALLAQLAGADMAVTLRERIAFPRAVFERLPRLRLLVASGMRNAAVDMEAARGHGVAVCGTPSGSAPPVELTWALLLGLARNTTEENGNLVSGGAWQSTVGTDLYGSTLGVLGLGNIGSSVARIALAFGMDVQAWSHNLTAERCAEVGVRKAESLKGLLGGSDFVSVHLKLGPRTTALLGREELALMRPGAFLVNTSRSAIVDQAALAECLRAGSIAGAGLDVFDTEPLPADDPLRGTPRLLATPHLGYVTRNNLAAYYGGAVEDIRAFLDRSPIRVLNPAP